MADRILVVEDEAAMRKSIGIMLRREGYLVTEVASGADAMAQAHEERFDLVVTDLRLGPVSGLDVLRDVKSTQPEIELIVVTAYGTIPTAVEAIKLGAFDFVTKPFQVEELLLRVRNALQRRRLTQEIDRLRVEVRSASGVDTIVGTSPSITEVRAAISRFAQIDSTVLITGESGTGKELAARALHAGSARAREPFVAVSCATLPDQLLESELFGHVKGAFTGAVAGRKGLIEEAAGGTFFLDEIGEAPPAVQAKLLRVLEEHSIRRLGDNRSFPVDVRVVAATNRDLPHAVRDRSFRGDLFYRLNVIRIHLPTLRDRPADIPMLAEHVLKRHAGRLGRYITGFTPAALTRLGEYDFPGNVRELSNVVEQAAALAAGPLVDVADLHPWPPSVPDGTAPAAPGSAPSAPQRLAQLEQVLILDRIRARAGNLALVAEDLGISRTTLWRRMKEYQLRTRRSEPK